MRDAGDALPPPPGRLPEPGFALDLVPNLQLWRLHWESKLIRPPSHVSGKYRFDAPGDGREYHVTYASDDDLGLFGEVFGDTKLIPSHEAGRQYSRIAATRPLSVIALDDATVQKTLGLDGRICTAKQYPTTMLWSRALHRWFPAADGIRYTSRHAGPSLNYCLFLSRCSRDLDVTLIGSIGDLRLRTTLLDACDRFRLTNLIPRPLHQRRLSPP